jgi:carbon storage regulator
MLVLSRKSGEKVCIGKDITITVVELKGDRMRIGIDAPDQVVILREELVNSREPPSTHSLSSSVDENRSIRADEVALHSHHR